MRFSLGTWCTCCVARYQCVTALELTDESTEPDPGIAFGCKQTSYTNFATWGRAVHTVYFVLFLAPLQLCNIMQSRFFFYPLPSVNCLEAVSCCSVVLLVSTSGFCTECSYIFFHFITFPLLTPVLLYPYCSKSSEKCTDSQIEKWLHISKEVIHSLANQKWSNSLYDVVSIRPVQNESFTLLKKLLDKRNYCRICLTFPWRN